MSRSYYSCIIEMADPTLNRHSDDTPEWRSGQMRGAERAAIVIHIDTTELSAAPALS